MKALLFIWVVLISFSGVSQGVDTLYQHQLYKVEYGPQLAPESVVVNGTGMSLLFFLGNYGEITGSVSQFDADLAYCADLNFDGIVSVGDLLVVLGDFGSVIWNQAQFGCSSELTTFACWLSYFPDMQLMSVMWLIDQPIRMVRTENPSANWWWFTNQ